MFNNYKRWNDDLVVGGRIAASYGRDRYEFGTVTEIGKPRGRYNTTRPGYVKVQWDNPNTSAPTKFNSSGDEWGTGGKSYRSLYSWSLMNAEQAVKSREDAEKEKFFQQQRQWLDDRLREVAKFRFDDASKKAAELRHIADMLEGDWCDGKPLMADSDESAES